MVDVHGVRDQGGCGVRGGAVGREHGHRVGDAERLRAAAPARCGDAAYRVGMTHHHRAVQGAIVDAGNPDRERFARAQMQGDVAAIVDAGATQGPAIDQCREDLVGDGTCHGRHRRDEYRAVRPARGDHASRDRTVQPGLDAPQRLPQCRQFLYQGRQHCVESCLRLRIGAFDFVPRVGPRLDEEVYRAVLQMQGSVFKAACGSTAPCLGRVVRGHRIGRRVRGVHCRSPVQPWHGSSGQGFSSGQSKALRSDLRSTSSSATMLPRWPPSCR